MTLLEYLNAGDGRLGALAGTLGRSISGVRKWAYGQRQPSLDEAIEIECATNGEVTIKEMTKAAVEQARAA